LVGAGSDSDTDKRRQRVSESGEEATLGELAKQLKPPIGGEGEIFSLDKSPLLVGSLFLGLLRLFLRDLCGKIFGSCFLVLYF
jgi:hypothetical protein